VETGVRVAALLPPVAHRQWTLSLPFTLRFLVVKRSALLKRLERLLVRAVCLLLRRQARRLGGRRLCVVAPSSSPSGSAPACT
jgi:hypothetical protein